MNQIVKTEPLLKDEEAIKFNDFMRQALKTHFPVKNVFELMWSSPLTIDVYEYMLTIEHPITAKDLIHRYGRIHNKTTVYRILKRLREIGLVACMGFKYGNKMIDGQFIPVKKRIALWVAV